MRFAQLTDTAYSRFAERQERMSFAQLPAYAATRRDQGAEVSLVGVVDGDPERILAAAIVSYQPWKRVFKRANIVFGPTFEEYSPEVERVFYEGLLDFVKRDKSVLSVRVTPATIRRHYDDITPGDETAQAQNLDRLIEDLGGHRVMLDFSERPDIPVRFSYVKNIEGMDFAAVQKSTGQQVRTAFNRKGTNGVEVTFVEPDQIDTLERVLNHTAERTNMPEISASRIEYYALLAEHLGADKAFLPVAILHTATYLEQIAEERAEVSAKLEDFSKREADLEVEGKALGKKQRNQMKELQSRLDVLAKRETETRGVQAEHGDEVILAASLFVASPNELTYVVSGAYSQFTAYYGIYLIHREMFEWATANDVKIYNFYGITGDFSDEASDAGVLHFKRQFSGDVEEYVGTYDLPVRPTLAKTLGALD